MAKTTVAIIGVGLMGGSLGLALKRTGRYRVIGIGRSRTKLRDAQRRRAIDAASTDEAAVRDADIVVIATPVTLIAPTLKRLLPFLKSGALVTDVGSVKTSVLKAVAQLKLPRSVSFVGGHPLAGSHRVGMSAARADLYRGATCVLVPLKGARTARIAKLWKDAGAVPLTLSAQAHDRSVALISHLPHAIAHALVHAVRGAANQTHLKKLFAGSFRDMTRVASADPEQWRQIFQMNQPEVRHALKTFRRELTRFEKALSHSSLASYLGPSHRYRRPLFHGQ